MSEDRLRALDLVERELERAVRADLAHARRWRRARWRPTALFAALVLLLGGGIAVAASLVLGTGDPVPVPRLADVGAEARPVAGSGRLAGVQAADPQGGPAWDVRVSQTAGGGICTAVGQRYQERFGIVGLDRVFRELPLGAADACGDRPTGTSVQVGARTAVEGGTLAARTIVAGVAGPGVAAVQIGAAGAPLRAVKLGDGRGFATVFSGYPESVRPVVRVRALGGGTQTLRLADNGGDVALDPDGKAPWTVEAGRAEAVPTVAGFAFLKRNPRSPVPARLTRRAPGRCVQLSRVSSSQPAAPDVVNAFGSFTPLICGDVTRRPVSVAMRRFVPGTNAWGLNPARTVVWGAVRGDVVAAELRVPGAAPRRVRVGREGRSIAEVLDGRIDPRRLELRLRLRDGRLVVQRGSTSLHGGRSVTPIKEPATPPYRTLAAARKALSPGFAIPTRGSIRSGSQMTDPAGGTPWVLRTFLGTLAPGTKYAGPKPGPFTCWEVGRLSDGVLRRPTAGNAGPPLTFGETDARCNDDKPQPRVPVVLTAYAADATAYSPRVGSIVVEGMTPTARRVELLGLPSGTRRLPLVGHGGFLAVLSPGEVRGALRVRATLANGTVRTSGRLDAGRGSPTTVDARAPDPDGAAPWAVVVGTRCVRMGQLVGGRLGYVDPSTGAVQYGNGVASSCGERLGGDRPGGQRVSLGVQSVRNRQAGTTEAQRQRRTLTGRTILYGRALPGVTSLTIRTPRDVRTVRPTGRGRAFIVAYDGTLTGGNIVITPHGPNPGPSLRQPASF